MAAQGGGEMAGGDGSGLRPAKRVAAMMYDSQSKYPEIEPEILSCTCDYWQPVPGTLVETETEICFTMVTPRERWLRFAKWPFFIKHKADYRNHAFVAAGGEGRAGLVRPIAMARDRHPASYIDPDLGLYASTFARMEFSIDGVPVTGRGNVPLGDNQALYQKVTRAFMTRAERAAFCDTRERVRYTSDITYANNTMTETQKAAARLLHFEDFTDANTNALSNASSADGLWPLSRRDPILNRLHGRPGQSSNPMFRPGTLLEARFIRHTPRNAYIQTDATRLPDNVALSGTAATQDGNAANGAADVNIILKEFKILFELLELKDQKLLLLKELKYYHDAASVSFHTLTSGVDTAFHNVPVQRGTKLLYIVPCYSHQVYYNAGQRKNKVLRFPALTNLKSIKFQLGDTPIYSSSPVDGLQNNRANLTPSSFQLFSYLYQRKMFDEPFHKFRPDANNENNYIAGIYPIDLTTYTRDLLDADLKMTLAFEGATSPANSVIMVVSVSEAMWRCEVASKQWTLESVGHGSKKARLL